MNIYDTPYFNQGNNNEEIIEQDTWRTNMNPQLNRGNYGVSNLNQAPFTGIQQIAHPNMADVSGPVRQDNTSGFDLSNMDLDNPYKEIGPMINFKDAPVELGETLKGYRMNNPRFGPIDMWRNHGGNETTGIFSNFRDKLGMTQVSPEDRAANKAYMAGANPWSQEMGLQITRDPQTGRMIGGDFEGMNPAGKSGWGSANFGEMAQNWMDDYGDVEYSIGAIGDMKRKKQARMKKAAIEYAQKLKADKIAADAAKAAPTTGGPDMSIRGWDPQHAAPQRPDRPGGFTDPGKGSYGPWSAQGGYMTGHTRSRYNQGGRVGILAAF